MQPDGSLRTALLRNLAVGGQQLGPLAIERPGSAPLMDASGSQPGSPFISGLLGGSQSPFATGSDCGPRWGDAAALCVCFKRQQVPGEVMDQEPGRCMHTSHATGQCSKERGHDQPLVCPCRHSVDLGPLPAAVTRFAEPMPGSWGVGSQVGHRRWPHHAPPAPARAAANHPQPCGWAAIAGAESR